MLMSPIARDKRLNILVTSEEHEMLQTLADREGITASDYVRLFIRKAYAESLGSEPKGDKRRRK